MSKEFTCDNGKCRKECEEIWSFTQYGGKKRQEEAKKNKSYCKDCFEEIEEKLK